MGFVFKWLFRIAGAMIALIVAGVVLVYYLGSRSLPEYNADLQVPYLISRVEIVRDKANVPHIFGENDQDVFYALGYAHAQDRMWQMSLLRRTAQGRLSELFGPATLRTDDMMRRLDIYSLATASVEYQDEHTLRMLRAYATGVNVRLDQINAQALGRGAPEMFLFSAPVSPWRPADSLAIIKLMGLRLSGHLDNEVIRARISQAIPDPDRLKDILPDAPGSGLAALPEFAQLFPDAPTKAAEAPFEPPLLSPFQRKPFSSASNVWAAAPSRSAAGGTLLANDPHLGFAAPSIWYLARLELESGGVIGGTIPGMPLVLAGRSDVLGWGLTSAGLDDQDLYFEQLNPDNSTEYLTPDGYKPFRTRKSIINIKDEVPVTITQRWTDNGPVLTGTHFNVGTIVPPGHVAALSWTVLSGQDTSMSAAMTLMGSKTVADGFAAMEDYVAPAQNLVLADRETIGMQMVGKMPRRDARHETQGRMPSAGWKEENRWQGTFPYAANPQFLAPAGGILGNTNNKVVDRPFPNHVSFDWNDTQRIKRWERLMQARQVHTRDSFVEAQLDSVSYTAQSLLPLIGSELWFSGEAAPEGTALRQRQRALTLLAEWSGEMNEHMPEPLIFSAWLRSLQLRMVQDELGPLARELTHVEPLFIERAFRNIDGAAAWCDVIQSQQVETCADMARLALDDALIWIGENWGQSLETLRWGDAHQATHDHPVLGEIPVLRYFVNIRQSTNGGDNTLQRGRTRGTGPNPFQNVHGAGYRGVYDFADPDSSVFIISTGQSGHFLSRHYDDMAQLWRRGEYIPMSLDENLARAGAVGITRLFPGN